MPDASSIELEPLHRNVCQILPPAVLVITRYGDKDGGLFSKSVTVLQYLNLKVFSLSHHVQHNYIEYFKLMFGCLFV